MLCRILNAERHDHLKDLLVIVFNVKSIFARKYINFQHDSRNTLDEVFCRLDHLRI